MVCVYWCKIEPSHDAGSLKLFECAHCLLLVLVLPQVQLNTGGLQYIRLAQPVSGAQVVQGQIQTLATNTQQVKHKRKTQLKCSAYRVMVLR